MVGDLMWLRDSWGTFLSPDVLAYLNGHEVVLGNLESPISSHFRVPSLWPDYFSYNSDPRLITSFRRPDGTSTFTALATANNHCLDRGDVGLGDTLAWLDSQHILHSGVRPAATDRPWVAFEAGGVRFGFYAACWGLNNPEAIRTSAFHIEVLQGLVPKVRLPVDLSRIRGVLAEMASERIDFRIICLHWGHEFEFYPCPLLMQVGREIIRAGADVVMGSHPHVIQPVEVCLVNGYQKQLRQAGWDLPALDARTGCLLEDHSGVPRKGLIVYSLGNFATAMYTLHCRTGLVLGLHLLRDAATSRVDWHRPEVQLVFNVRRDHATGQRRLKLMDRYLRECDRRGDRAAKLRSLVRYLERHLLGEEEYGELGM
jgi:poly-gamma-glutamate synthesis protein (capsule biosynthesis protein)